MAERRVGTTAEGDACRKAELEKKYSVADFPFKVIKPQPPSPDVWLFQWLKKRLIIIIAVWIPGASPLTSILKHRQRKSVQKKVVYHIFQRNRWFIPTTPPLRNRKSLRSLWFRRRNPYFQPISYFHHSNCPILCKTHRQYKVPENVYTL